jgi:hypothetical protein
MRGGRWHTMESPRDLALAMERRRTVPEGRGERFAGYGVPGLPFSSGHILAFRRMTATSLGLPYTTVWHRDPAGMWTLFADVEPERACPRFFGGALQRVVVGEIEVGWEGPLDISLWVPEVQLQWGVRLAADVMTVALALGGRLLPGPLWRREGILSALGKAGGRLLGVGNLALSGSAPNGQRFRMTPRRLWRVAAAAAVLDGEDMGVVGPLQKQARLGDFWIPNRGILGFGEALYDTLDPARHSRASTCWTREGFLPVVGR